MPLLFNSLSHGVVSFHESQLPDQLRGLRQLLAQHEEWLMEGFLT